MRILFTLEEGAKVPAQGYSGDAGWDLYTLENFSVPPGALINTRTGIRIAMDEGYFGRITARSSTIKTGLVVLEGIIDNGWRGELLIRVYNIGLTTIDIRKGTRLAQLIVHTIHPAQWVLCKNLPKSTRGNKGFGSSGQ